MHFVSLEMECELVKTRVPICCLMIRQLISSHWTQLCFLYRLVAPKFFSVVFFQESDQRCRSAAVKIGCKQDNLHIVPRNYGAAKT